VTVFSVFVSDAKGNVDAVEQQVKELKVAFKDLALFFGESESDSELNSEFFSKIHNFCVAFEHAKLLNEQNKEKQISKSPRGATPRNTPNSLTTPGLAPPSGKTTGQKSARKEKAPDTLLDSILDADAMLSVRNTSRSKKKNSEVNGVN